MRPFTDLDLHVPVTDRAKGPTMCQTLTLGATGGPQALGKEKKKKIVLRNRVLCDGRRLTQLQLNQTAFKKETAKALEKLQETIKKAGDMQKMPDVIIYGRMMRVSLFVWRGDPRAQH